jgi:F-type H+-transporting ATPase subunit delta
VSGKTSTLASVSGRYAKALFDLAQDENRLDEIADELDRLGALLDENADLERLISSPVFSRAEQANVLARVLEKMQVSGLATRFIALLSKNGRVNHIRSIIAAYHALLAQERGEITAEITSAVKLSAAQVKKLQAALKALTGRKTSINQNIDEKLLGGLIVKLGSRMYDSSLRTKLFNLQRVMKEIG